MDAHWHKTHRALKAEQAEAHKHHNHVQDVLLEARRAMLDADAKVLASLEEFYKEVGPK